MDFRSRFRAQVIRSAALLCADRLAIFLQDRRRPQAVVVAVHETPASRRAQFLEQLNWAAQHFTITTLEGFAALWEKPHVQTHDKPLLLFTFDDGRESNYSVAAPLLESFGGRGVFFIVPAFAECAADDQRALAFYRARINPESKPGDEAVEDWKPMNPAQISELAARGHAIGNHTLTHECLRGLSPEALEREISESARKLTSWTKKPVDAFAWTFGWDEIDANSWQAIQRHHRFCFSPCAGVIDSRRDPPSLLWRREIEVRYSADEFRFSYSGLVDLWWRRRRKRLRELLLESAP